MTARCVLYMGALSTATTTFPNFNGLLFRCSGVRLFGVGSRFQLVQRVSATQQCLPSQQSVSPVTAVRDLGVHLDADMSMTAHVTATVRSCFAVLRQIHSVHHSLSRDALVALIRALVVTKLDYCCSVMVGMSGTLLRRLQSVLNAAVRLVFSARRSDHITPVRHCSWNFIG